MTDMPVADHHVWGRAYGHDIILLAISWSLLKPLVDLNRPVPLVSGCKVVAYSARTSILPTDLSTFEGARMGHVQLILLHKPSGSFPRKPSFHSWAFVKYPSGLTWQNSATEAFMRAWRFRVESAEGSWSWRRYISQIQWIHEDCWKFI
jgi:hypothetical protein